MKRMTPALFWLACIGGTAVAVSARPASALSTPTPGDVSLSITPLRVELGVQSGVQTSQPVRIANTGAVGVQIRGQVVDWTLTEGGDIIYRKPGEGSWGCGKWIRMNPLEFTLPAGEMQLVRYTMSVPVSAGVGGYHCGLLFDMLPPPKAKIEGSMGVVNLIRMVTAIYPTIGTPEIQATIERLELKPRTGKDRKGWELVTAFGNAGSTHYRVDGSVEVLDEGGKVLRQYPYGNFPVLPKTPRVVRFDLLEELPAGQYRLRAVVDVGRKEKLAAETRVTVAAR